MSCTAIICEYNPFHRGHAYHIARTRAAFPDSPVVCVMSGQFVQRGEPAILSKRARAEAALCAGASLVVELPAAYALAGAQAFADGGAAAAAALGAERLSFGSESGDTEGLRRTAALTRDEEFRRLLKTALGTGVGYAAARAAVVKVLAPELERFVTAPNDILAVEYARAAEARGLDLFAVPRVGAPHDGDAPRGADAAADADAAAFASASTLRAYIREGRTDVSAFCPDYAGMILQRETQEGRAPVTPEALDACLLAVLRDCTAEDFVRYADVSEGLENRLLRALREQGSFDRAVDAAVSKRYPRARIRRACWRTFLRIPAAWSKEEPPFLRVLGLTPEGAALLREAKLPILTKPAHIAEFPARAREWFAADERAGDLYALAYPDAAQRTAGQERRMTPVFLEG